MSVKSPETADTGSNEALSSDGKARFRVPPLVAETLLDALEEELVETLLEVLDEVDDEVDDDCDVLVELEEELVVVVFDVPSVAA